MIFALVDCNNFYASCERVVNPALNNKPVVVLSNNDGCVIARSNEAKALGVEMGVPFFQIKVMAKEQGVIALSANFLLYGHLSNRVMGILTQASPRVEVYSIDECFLDLDRVQPSPLEYARELRAKVLQWVGIPVSIGLGPNKTLAKLANFAAKRMPEYGGVFDLTALSNDDLNQFLQAIPIRKLWGIGRRLNDKLARYGITNAWHLRYADQKTMQKHFGVVLKRMIMELNGESCLSLTDVIEPRKQILCSRTFATNIYTKPELETALTSYVSRAAEKLREQESLAGSLTVFLRTNPFGSDWGEYRGNKFIRLPEPTDNTIELAKVVVASLDEIFRLGYGYKRGGVMLTDIRPAIDRQLSIFQSPESVVRGEKLMKALDGVNERFGHGALRLATERPSWRKPSDAFANNEGLELVL